MNIQGNWTGVIIYGKGYRENQNKELYFDMHIKQDAEKIYGEAFDTGGTGVSTDVAIIKGTFIQNKISFTKQYTHSHFYTDDEVIIDKSMPGHIIVYAGEFDESQQTFKGSWVITQKVWFFGIIPYRYTCRGTWTMYRK